MSEKKNNRDKIEDIFRDKLSRENLSSEPWNTPPSHVIESALDQLQSDRNNRRLFILPILFLFLAGFIALWVRSDHTAEDIVPVDVDQKEVERNQIESTPEILTLIEDVPGNTQNSKANLGNPNKAAKKEIAEASAKERKSTEHDERKTELALIESKSNEKISSPALASKDSKEKERSVYTSQEKIKLSAITLMDKEEKVAKLNQKRTGAVHPEIAFPLLEVRSRETLILPAIKPSTPVKTNTQPFKWEAQMLTGAEWMRYDARNLPSENGKLSGHHDWNAGYNAQLRLANSLRKNWGIDLSLGFSMLKNKSHYLMNVQTDDMNIQVDQFGHTHIYMEPEVKTPISEAKMSLDYIMQFANTYDPGPANFQVQILQSLHTVQAATGIFRSFTLRDALQWRIHTGVNYRRIIKLEEEMSVYVWHNDEKMIDQRASRDITSQVNNHVFEWYTGLSAHYPIARNWLVNAHIQTNVGLNKVNSIGGQDVRMQTIQLGVGLVRKF